MCYSVSLSLSFFFCRMMKSSSRAQPRFTRSNRSSAWLLKALETDSAFLSPSPTQRCGWSSCVSLVEKWRIDVFFCLVFQSLPTVMPLHLDLEPKALEILPLLDWILVKVECLIFWFLFLGSSTECASRLVHLYLRTGAVTVGTSPSGDAGQYGGEGWSGESGDGFSLFHNTQIRESGKMQRGDILLMSNQLCFTSVLPIQRNESSLSFETLASCSFY